MAGRIGYWPTTLGMMCGVGGRADSFLLRAGQRQIWY
jgi:hypothetical protein